MANFKDRVVYGFIGSASGLAGMLSLAGCRSSCASCYGCAGTGLGILLTILMNKRKQEGNNGLA